MNHLVDYGVDSEEDDEGEMEMGRKSLEKSSVKGKEGKNSSPEGREGERGDGVEDAFDEDFKQHHDEAPKPSSSRPSRGEQGELVEPRPPRRYSEAGNGHASDESPDESDLEELAGSSARSGAMQMDTPETPKSSEVYDEEQMETGLGGNAMMGLPPSPPGACDPNLERKFIAYFDKKAQGVPINEKIKSYKGFKNPAIYEHLVNKYGIDEKGSNFAPDIFDPHGFDESDYHDALGEQQKKLHDKIGSQEKRLHTGHSSKVDSDTLDSRGRKCSRFDRKK